MKFVFLIIGALFATNAVAQALRKTPMASHIISGEFDHDQPVRVIAVCAADTANWIQLYSGSFQNSYTIKVPAWPSITVFFSWEGKTKRLNIPHTSDENQHFHVVDVLFSKKSSYLIYQTHKKRKTENIVLD